MPVLRKLVLVSAFAAIAGGALRVPVRPLAAGDDPPRANADKPNPVPHDFGPIDRLLEKFLSSHRLPGASLAIGYRGRIVCARGFGLADRESGRKVTPDTRFRIASISKPITAIAVLKLVSEGKLGLEDRVLDRLPEDLRGPCADSRWSAITIDHLLRHRGGWDRDQSIDCMFFPVEIAVAMGGRPPADARTIIRFMQTWPLDFDPGSRYAYSNFGYCLLGRVIEHVTGRSYASYVREAVLAPIGVTKMELGRTRKTDRLPGEATYYTKRKKAVCVFGADVGRPVDPPYGAWYLEAMDAHGGWVASAPDLVRFGMAVIAAPGNGLIGPLQRKAMLARPSQGAKRSERSAKTAKAGDRPEVYYGLGWFVRPGKDGRPTAFWHTGSLPGTSTLLVCREDGWCWAVLFNSRDTPSGKRPTALLDRRLHAAINRVIGSTRKKKGALTEKQRHSGGREGD